MEDCSKKTMTTTLILQLCSILGLLISLYFLAIYQGLIKGNTALVPQKMCSKNTCSEVLKTPFARVFKVPNFTLGILYYLMIFFLTVFTLPSAVQLFITIISWLAVVFSVYLAYALVVKLKTTCVLCFVSQTINLIIAVTLLLLPQM